MDSLAGKRLVIFGCGYIGAAVARWAITAGVRVTALTRNAATAVLLREFGVETVVADLAGATWHGEIEPAPEFVLDAVAAGGGGAEGYRRSYFEGIQSIAAWARARGQVGTFVYTSSTSVYAQGGGAVVDETMTPQISSDRARVLIETEQVIAGAQGAFERWFVLRLAGIYGPGRHHLLEQVRAGEVAGVGEHHLNLIHRDDVADAIARCFVAPASVRNEVFNVADDGRATKAEITTWLAGQLRVPPPRFSGEPAGDRRRVTPDRVIANAKLKDMLGWRPRYPTFQDGYANLLSR